MTPVGTPLVPLPVMLNRPPAGKCATHLQAAAAEHTRAEADRCEIIASNRPAAKTIPGNECRSGQGQAAISACESAAAVGEVDAAAGKV